MTSDRHHTTDAAARIPREVGITDHAVDQYVQRVKPCLDVDAARAELERMVEQHAALVDVAPAWARDGKGRSHFLLIGDSVCLPLAHDHNGDWQATTCLTPGTLTAVERRRRRDRRAA